MFMCSFCCYNYEILFIFGEWRLEMFKMSEENRIVWVVFIVEDYFVIVVEVESLRLVC